MTKSIGEWIKAKWAYPCFFLSGMILVLVLRIIVAHFREEPVPAPPPPPKKSVSVELWGVMETETVMLERPEELFQQHEPPPEIIWRFGRISPADLRTLIESVGLTASQQATLLDEKRWRNSEKGISIVPPLDLVRDMDAAPRQKLYETLARTRDNLPQQFPFTFRGSFEEWFAGCELSPDIFETVSRMIYKRGDTLVFADLPYFQVTTSSNEVHELVRQISRVPALFVRVKLGENFDLKALKKYWMNESREMEPLIDSLARVKGGIAINVAALLPPLPRLLLYSYPQPRADLPRNADCVWTSLNFFNTQPDNRIVNEAFAQQVLQTQYELVTNAPAFGDLIMLCAPEAGGRVRVVHMCTHIAGDVVFTKNGGDIYQPWVLMHFADVKALFGDQANLRTAVYRRRPNS